MLRLSRKLYTEVICGFLLVCTGIARAEQHPETTQTISFPGSLSAPSDALITDDHGHIAYEASLIADPDTEGRPIVVDLVLRHSGTTSTAQNLIAPAGNWHGMEPFSMVAADVKKGSSSVFGLHRRIPIQGSHEYLSMDIEDVRVTGCKTDAGCAFASVLLSIAVLPSA